MCQKKKTLIVSLMEGIQLQIELSSEKWYVIFATMFSSTDNGLINITMLT